MALKRAEFTLTADAFGVGADTVHIPIPATPERPVFLEAVSFDDTAAVGRAASFSLYESNVDDYEGRQLFFIDGASIPAAEFVTGASGAVEASPSVVYPRVSAVDAYGVSSSLGARILMRSNYLRARLVGCTSGDVYTVVAYYETAGDQRF